MSIKHALYRIMTEPSREERDRILTELDMQDKLLNIAANQEDEAATAFIADGGMQ